MFLTTKNAVIRHIDQNKVRYFFLILCLLSGMVAGILFVGTVSQNQSDELNQFINTFCKQAAGQSIPPSEIFIASILSNLRIICLMWVCGLVFILSPVVYGLVAVKGFGIGFTVGFLSFHFGFKGFMLAMVSILPQGIFLLPALFYMAHCAIRFASQKRKRKKGTGSSMKYDEMKEFKRFTYCIIAGGVILLFTSVIDSFIVPVFVKGICGLFVG